MEMWAQRDRLIHTKYIHATKMTQLVLRDVLSEQLQLGKLEKNPPVQVRASAFLVDSVLDCQRCDPR